MASNNQIEVVEEKLESLEGNRFFETARKVLMAGIGVVALSVDEAEEFVNRLVERGEIAEKDGRQLINEMMEKRSKDAKQTARKAEKGLDKRIEELLHGMNVPSKADIDKLSRKISTLNKKIDELKKAQEA